MKRQIGFVRWFDKVGDDGILTDFEGREHYFNSWSFPKSVWGATGICKKTGKKKTIRTRFWPGMFLVDGSYPDPVCEKLKNGVPVEFEQADGIEQRWAVRIKLRPDLREEVLSYQISTLLESMAATEFDFSSNWHEYYERRLAQILEENKK